jgi:hypothetical protein
MMINLEGILECLLELNSQLKVVFPCIPDASADRRIRVRCQPAGFAEPCLIEFWRFSAALPPWSDSGGIQEETTYLKVPCLTL